MRRHSFTGLAIVLVLGFGIFFGVELATRGMEQIQGPISTNGPQSTVQTPASTQQNGTGSARTETPAQTQTSPAGSGAGGQSDATGKASPAGEQPKPRPKPQIQPGAADSGINRVGNGIGDMLQTVAHGTIRTVVSLLDSFVK
jgi:cytoskeletal protein RodZ